MSTIVVTPPTTPLLDAPTLRKRLGITDASKDDNLVAYVAAATAVLDGPEGWLGRALGQQTLRTSGSNFPWFHGHGYDAYGYGGYPGTQYLAYEAVKLLCPPIVSISSITYVDKDGVTQTLDPSAYRLSSPRTLYPVYGTFWPSGRIDPDSVQITYTAGYPGGGVPAPILAAIVLGVAKLQSMIRLDIGVKADTVFGVQSLQYETQADFAVVYDRTAMALLAPYRVVD